MTDTTLSSSRPREHTGRRLSVTRIRALLALDAGVTAANGAAYVLAADPLGDLLGLSPSLLRGTGAFLLVFAALVALAARRPRPARGVVIALIAINAVWALDSLVVAGAGWGSPTSAGTAWIVAQGLAVAGFGVLQVLALRGGRDRG